MHSLLVIDTSFPGVRDEVVKFAVGALATAAAVMVLAPFIKRRATEILMVAGLLVLALAVILGTGFFTDLAHFGVQKINVQATPSTQQGG